MQDTAGTEGAKSAHEGPLPAQPAEAQLGNAESRPLARLATVAVADPVVLVLADGPSRAAVSNAKGHLFEQFVAQLLHTYGYDEPTRGTST